MSSKFSNGMEMAVKWKISFVAFFVSFKSICLDRQDNLDERQSHFAPHIHWWWMVKNRVRHVIPRDLLDKKTFAYTRARYHLLHIQFDILGSNNTLACRPLFPNNWRSANSPSTHPLFLLGIEQLVSPPYRHHVFLLFWNPLRRCSLINSGILCDWRWRWSSLDVINKKRGKKPLIPLPVVVFFCRK